MAIDDPIDAINERVAGEDRVGSSLSRFIPNLATLARMIPSTSEPLVELGKSLLTATGLWISNLEASRREYLMTGLTDELRRVRGMLESLDEAHRRFVAEEFLPLVLDGLQKAEQTRSQQRIRRIAAILAHAFEVGPAKSIDIAEEMMRIAVALSNDDVLVLRAIYEGQRADYSPKTGRTSHEQANEFWRLLDPGHRSSGEPEIASLARFSVGSLQGICAKLQSLGLVVQVERNQMKLSPGVIPYAMLAKAVDFVEYIHTSD